MFAASRSSAPGRGPSWVGIGAQRSGTTWFTQLATSHPAVTLARGGRKELHYFDRFLVDPHEEIDRQQYRELFGWHGSGEFTPSYLRSPWVPQMLLDACDRPPLILVLLRDPIERMESAVRWRMHLDIDASSTSRDRSRLATGWWESALIGSMYGGQLAHWREVVGRENMLVLQYEAVLAQPEEVMAAFWRRLGFGPVPLTSVRVPSSTKSAEEWALPAAWRQFVVDQVGPEMERTFKEWPVDRSLWNRWVECDPAG